MRIVRLICGLVIAVGLFTIPVYSREQVVVGVSVRIGPPPLPVYVQPVCPEPGYIWAPGYWAYGPDGYFWVPGTWVEPPEVGLLWTPGYWGGDGFYLWHAGYWGPEVGNYGGINYGFGYPGVGFFGGYWRGGAYFYNRAVTNVDVTVVRNTYHTTVVNQSTNRVSFNGGPGGLTARPTEREIAAGHQRRSTMTAEQTQHQQAASTNRTLHASVSHGRTDVASTVRPGQLGGRGAVESGRPYSPNRPANGERSNRDRPPSLGSPNANSAMDERHQQELDRLRQRQTEERQRIEQKHRQQQQLQQRAASDRQQQEAHRKQQQQLQQLDRKHEQQQQKLEQKQQQERQKQQKPRSPSRLSANDKASSRD